MVDFRGPECDIRKKCVRPVKSVIGVKLDNVTWLGAKSVQNVIKIGADFGAYGRHMEFIADGENPDTAWIEFGGEKYDLANKASDVSCATFGFPAALADIEPGTQVTFWMKSRGGIADGHQRHEDVDLLRQCDQGRGQHPA